MKKFIVVIVSILAMCGAVGGYYYLKHAAADRRQATQRMARAEVEVRRLIEQLKVPPEAIHIDYGALRKIAKLRRQSFQKQGVHEYYPYANQVRSGSTYETRKNRDSPFSDLGRSLPVTKPSEGVSYRFTASMYSDSSSLEQYWTEHVNNTCERIVRAFKGSNSDLRDYLKQHPKIYEEEIRPRLLLLAESRNGYIAVKACKALAAAGERTEFLRQRLIPMAMGPWGFKKDQAVDVMKQCGFPVPAPWPAMESLSAYEDDAVVGKDAQGDPLPAGALLRVGQTRLRHGGWIAGLAFSQDGKLLASGGGGDRSVRVWDTTTGRLVAEKTFDGWVSHLAFAPDGTIAVLAKNVIQLWNPHDGSLKLTLTAEKGRSFSSLAISLDGTLLAAGNGSGVFVQIYKLPSGEATVRIDGLEKSTFRPQMRFLPDNRRLLYLRGGRYSCLLDAVKGDIAGQELPSATRAEGWAVLADSGIATVEKGVLVFRDAYGLLQSSKPMPQGMTGVIAGSGRLLALSGRDGTRFYDADTLKPVGAMITVGITARDAPSKTVLSSDGRLLATRTGSAVRLWDTATGQELHAGSSLLTCPGMLDGPIDGRMLYLNVSRPDDEHGRYFCRVDIGTGEITRVVPAGPDKVEVAAVSGDGTVLATYGKYAHEPPTASYRWPRALYRLMLWNLQTGQPIGEITPAYKVQSLRFDPHHSRLIVYDNANGDENVCMSVYDVSRRQLLYRLPVGSHQSLMFAGRPTYVSSKADGMVMLGLGEGRLKAWFERAGMQTVEFNPLVKVSAAAQSRESKWVATFSGGEGLGVQRGILRIWEVGDWFREDGRANLFDPKLVGMHKLQVAVSPKDERWGFRAAAYSPKDEFLLTTQRRDSFIIVWDLKGRPLGRITGHAGPVVQIRFVGDRLVSTSVDTTLLVWDWPKIADWCRRQVKNNKAATRPHP